MRPLLSLSLLSLSTRGPLLMTLIKPNLLFLRGGCPLVSRCYMLLSLLSLLLSLVPLLVLSLVSRSSLLMRMLSN